MPFGFKGRDKSGDLSHSSLEGGGKKPEEPGEKSEFEEVRKMFRRLQLAALAGCGLIVLYSLQFYPSASFFRIASIGVVIAGAFAFVGFLLGFVFCIPRTTEPSSTSAPSSTEREKVGSGNDRAAAKGVALAKSNISTNTNLVDISDWLTKILVGVGLVELNKIPDALKALSTYLGRGLRECDSSSCIQSSESFALSIVIFFFAAGFIIGYLWTRIYFQNALSGIELRQKQVELERAHVELRNKDNVWSDIAAAAADAERLLAEGEFDQALQMMGELLKKDPESASAWMIKGRILKKKAQVGGKPGDKKLLQEALQCATTAAELMPDRGGPRYNMACYQALLGLDRTEILGNLKQALELNPKLVVEARGDEDLVSLLEDEDFKRLTKP